MLKQVQANTDEKLARELQQEEWLASLLEPAGVPGVIGTLAVDVWPAAMRHHLLDQVLCALDLAAFFELDLAAFFPFLLLDLLPSFPSDHRILCLPFPPFCPFATDHRILCLPFLP